MRFTSLGWVSLLSSAVLCWSCTAGHAVPLEKVDRRSGSAGRAASSQAAEEFPDQVLDVFFPYRDGPPQSDGLRPGMAVSRGNWQLARDALLPEMLQAVRKGECTILIQDTTNLPVSPAYINATREFAHTVSLSTTGNLVHYQAGLPFPVLDASDPQAGLKAAWNVRYADQGDSLQRWESLLVRNREGEHQHGISFFYARAYGMHRARPEGNIPEWETVGILYKEFMQVYNPAPTQILHPQLGLVHLRYWYDEDSRPVGQWYLTGFLERPNRLRVLAYNPEASAWQFPVLYEDLFGTSVAAYQWRLLGTKVALVPGFVQGVEPLLGGYRAGYPLDPWELRTVYVVEAIPQRSAHPYGRKVFVFDQQTFAPLYVVIYNQQGEHWRTGFFVYANPAFYPHGKEVRVPILIGRSWIDFAKNHVTVALVEEAIYNDPLPPSFFTQANMTRKGK